MIKKEYYLKGLDCAGCAARIEKAVGRLEAVEEAALNFVTATLYVKIKDGFELSSDEIISLISSVDSEVTVKLVSDSFTGGERNAGAEKSAGIEKGNENGDKELSDYYEIKILIRRIFIGIAFLTAAIYSNDKKISFALYSIAYLTGAYPLIILAVVNFYKKNLFDENFLMSIATLGAFMLGDYHEAVGVTLFFQAGEIFEKLSVARSRRSIKALMGLRPDYVNILKDGAYIKAAPEEASAGDIIRIRPGEKAALDCVVIEGSSSIDAGVLTGESLPRRICVEDEIPGGALNIDGLITARVLRPFAESSAAKILSLIEDSASKKAVTERFITKFAMYYTPAVVVLAVILCIAPWLFFSGDFMLWLKRALIFLVISCPCALVISIPLGFFGGIGAASHRGILIKGANHLEALNNIGVFIFDKTGTITRGNFIVTDVVVESGTREDILKYAAAAEFNSNHPIARAIRQAYGGSVDKFDVSACEEISGTGIKAIINGESVFVGHDRFLHDECIEHNVCVKASTTVHVVVNGKYSGYIVIADEIKSESPAAVEWLEKQGIHTLMLTGDNRVTAGNVAKMAGIKEYYADLLPHEKVEILRRYKNEFSVSKNIAFAGDGINDAPVIAFADIGFAMGGLGSDAAIEAADIVIMNDSPAKIIEAIKIARRTRIIVYQNIALALGVKGALLIFGAFGMATMWEAVFADVGVAVLAILNSMRAMRI